MDNNVALPAGRSLSWRVTTSERSDAVGGSVDITVSASDGVNNVSASDTLVGFSRDTCKNAPQN